MEWTLLNEFENPIKNDGFKCKTTLKLVKNSSIFFIANTQNS